MDLLNSPLHQMALDCARKFRLAEADLVDILQKVDASELYLELGVSSLFRYCTEILGLTDADSFRFIQVARKAKVVPELKEAVREGRITVGTASRIAPVITVENKSEWLQLAETLPQRVLEKEVARENPREVLRPRVRIMTEDLVELRVALTTDLHKRLRRAQDLASQKARKSVELTEVLEALVETYLDKHDPVRKATRAQPAVRQVPHSGDSKVRAAIPAPVRHQVFLRDRGRCTFRNAQGRQCAESRFIDIHHIKEVIQGGTNDPNNLATLCTWHHRWAHKQRKHLMAYKN